MLTHASIEVEVDTTVACFCLESPVATIWCLPAELHLALGVGAIEGDCLSFGTLEVVDLSPSLCAKREVVNARID